MFKTSFYYTFEKLLPKLLSFFVLPILLRLIKPELWAEITLLLAIQILISYFLTQGDERSILRFVEDSEVFSKSIMSLLRVSFVFIIIFEILGYFLQELPFSLIYGMPFRLMFLSTVVISLNKLFVSKLRTYEMATHVFKSSFFESLLIQSLQLLLIAITVELDGYDSRVIVTSYFFVQFLGNFLKLIYFSVSLKFNFKILVKYLTSKKPKDFLKFSNISFLILISGYILNWQDRFFVEHLFGFKELGVYSVATRISNIGMVFISSLLITSYAKYWPSENNDNKNVNVESIVKKILIISSLTQCSIMVLTTSVGKYILPEAYYVSVELIYLATLLVFLQTIVLVFTIDLGRKNRLKKVFYFNFLTFTTQFLIYSIFEFNSLTDIFFVQIISLLLYLNLLFFQNMKSLLNTFLKVILLFIFSIFITMSYIEIGSQLYQIIMFVFGIIFLSFTMNYWLKLEN